ncbi:uncharacterized protein [Arachis hypogaea]
MKKCLESMPCYGKLGEIIHNVLFSDSSIHNTLFQISCTTAQVLEKLHVSRLFDSMIIKGIQLAIGSVLEILVVMLTRLSKDNSSSFPIFLQAVFSCTTKSVPLITCVTSLISYFWNPADIFLGHPVGCCQVHFNVICHSRLLSTIFVWNHVFCP